MTITREQYFLDPHTGEPKPHFPEHDMAAGDLLLKVNGMLKNLAWGYPVDPDTGCSISGKHGGDGDGGFRAPDSKTGGIKSNHRTAHAVDVYDPQNKLDKILSDEVLEQNGLYREHPDSTNGWCHLQDLPPASGHRTYYP